MTNEQFKPKTNTTMKTIASNGFVRTKIITDIATHYAKPNRLAILRVITDAFPSVVGFLQKSDSVIKLHTFYGFVPCTFSVENQETRAVNQHLLISSYDVELLFDFPWIKKAVTIRVHNRFEKFNQDPDSLVYNCDVEMDLDGFKNEYVSNKIELFFTNNIAPRIETVIEQHINTLNESYIKLKNQERWFS